MLTTRIAAAGFIVAAPAYPFNRGDATARARLAGDATVTGGPRSEPRLCPPRVDLDRR